MTGTLAKLGIGTLLEYETVPGASPLAFTTLAEVGDEELPHTREFVEATNQSSAGGAREYIPGLIDNEQFDVPCNYIAGNTSHKAVWGFFKSGIKRKWRMVETTASPQKYWEFDAIVAGFNPSFPVAGKKGLKITLRRSGVTAASDE